MANRIQTIIRTAAMIYAEDQSLQTVKSVRRHKEYIKVLQERKQIIINNVVTGIIKVL